MFKTPVLSDTKLGFLDGLKGTVVQAVPFSPQQDIPVVVNPDVVEPDVDYPDLGKPRLENPPQLNT